VLCELRREQTSKFHAIAEYLSGGRRLSFYVTHRFT
jgi:hypothetical protein